MRGNARGRTAATAATAGHAIAAVWNPHATRRITLYEIMLFKQGGAGTAGDAFELRRSSARGTPGSTVTPAAANQVDNATAPPSGWVLDLAAFTVQPTLVAGGFKPWVSPAAQGAGIVLPIPEGIIIPPASGIVISQIAASIWPISDIGVGVDD